MKLELTRDEATEICAHHSAQATIRLQISGLQAQFARHVDGLLEVEARIRKRVKKLPKTPLAQWKLNIDQFTYEGSAEIPPITKGLDANTQAVQKSVEHNHEPPITYREVKE